MGSGSTIAAAEAVGYTATGLELDTEYFRLAEKAIPRLAALYPHFKGQEIEVELNGNVEQDQTEDQLTLALAEDPQKYGKII
jgi:site-specific DNA-methyltransferase (adenine-specific)